MSDKSPVKPAAKVLKRAPWMKFYTADWRADPGLRMCSFAARGLWMDMLTVMHEAELYGHLLLAGRSPKPSDLSSFLGGGNSDVVADLIEELEFNKVFSRTKKGVIFSRRMCADAEKAIKFSEFGKRGGNPNIINQGSDPINPTPTPGLTPPFSQPKGGGCTQSPEARLQTSESKLASQQAASGRESRIEAPSKTAEVVPIGQKPTMPAIHSPANEWLHLVKFREVDRTGITRACAGPERFGTYLDIAAERVMAAMGLKCGSKDWTPLIRWLGDGYDLDAQVLPVIERRHERGQKAPGSLQWYDSEIRQEPAQWAAKVGRTFPATLTAAP